MGMMRSGAGSICNIVSPSGVRGQAGQCNYAASKGGIIAFTKSLAREVGRFNIRVNAVCPGVVPSPMSAKYIAKEEQRLLAEIPLGRFGKPEEIAPWSSFWPRRRQVTSLARSSRSMADLTMRVLVSKKENTLIIDAKAGETSYIQLKVVMGAWTGVGEVQQVPEETGKAGMASLARQEPDWTRAGKTWLDGQTELAAINVNGTWHGSEWGDFILHQTQGSRELKGNCDKWDIHGVVSGNRVYLLFSSYGDVTYSAVLTAAGDKVLDGSYSKGLKAEDTNGKPMHLTKD
jgi:hypothetical protein